MLIFKALFCKDLSQRIRWLKWSRKKKSAQSTNESNPVNGVTPRKIFRVATTDLSKKSDESSLEDYEKHVKELINKNEKRQPNDPAIKMLFKETHNRRVQWITTLPSGTISPILKMFPIFESGRYVS